MSDKCPTCECGEVLEVECPMYHPIIGCLLCQDCFHPGHTHKSNKIVGHDICEKWKIRETLLFSLPVIFRCWKATTIIPTFS